MRSEREVQVAAVTYLAGIGCETQTEFPLLGRVADVFALDTAGLTIAVECKLSDWRRGLHQARTYTLAADVTYLCVPRRRVSPKLTEAAVQIGVGILAIGESTAEVMSYPPLPGRAWPSIRERTLSQFAGRRSAQHA